jgi:alkylated DNA nucleotide flippase Atl1
MKTCPHCRKQTLLYVSELGQSWGCKNCGFRSPMAKQMLRRAFQDLLKSIPRGKVTTYKALGTALGIHQRAAARLLATNESTAPCYKVICSDGTLGGYTGPGGVKGKIARLKADGIKAEDGKIDLSKFEHKFRIGS